MELGPEAEASNSVGAAVRHIVHAHQYRRTWQPVSDKLHTARHPPRGTGSYRPPEEGSRDC
jgi:hypothetical protein